MNDIHPTAIIGQDVVLGDGIKIHPYAVLDGKVEIGDGCIIGPYVHLTGWVKIGKRTKVYAHASIGEDPQDYTFDGTPGLCEIGDDCLIREGVTIHTPVHGDEGCKTSVANGAFLMANCHVAHNVEVGEKAIVANGTLLAGFVKVGEKVFLSGNIGIHQFCWIGAYSIVSPCAKVVQNVPPFMTADGNPAIVHGLNVVGLRRNNFPETQRSKIKDAYKMLYYSGMGFRDACDEIEAKYSSDEWVMKLVTFVRESKRGIIGAAQTSE
ncbi:MAG: acyl-[acyl-carrier-protein]--UDP-N-acetylglucosamine O-acyltransferase [Spirochaetes bacterium GWF1_51_8]|nr:MAG: acyl-[acyl-carrier-protein]--UDP-N-acetylglucosamine O-acyltransferase [Spirochaetes bacterium GWF1_51_8]